MNNRLSGRMLPCMLMILNLMPILNVTAYAESGSTKREPFKIQPAERLKGMLESPKRPQAQQPDRVSKAFGVEKGESVADIGAGTGFHAFRLADKVGPEGKVYAVEIQDELLAFISDKMKEKQVKNLVLVKSSVTDSNLPPQSCDKILLANTYYYLKDPVDFMSKVGKALKRGGRVAIIDLDANKITEKGIKSRRKIITPAELVDEMKQAGFQLTESFDFLDKRFFLVFRVVE